MAPVGLSITSYDIAKARPASALDAAQEAQLDALRRVHAQGDAVMRVALIAGELVAHVLLLLRISDDARFLLLAWNPARPDLAVRLADGRSALLTDLLVIEPHRRRGIGRALVDDAIAQARAAGAERLTLHVGADNLEAIRLYEDIGFARGGELSSFLEYVISL